MALNSRQLFCLLLVEISPEQLTTTALKRFNFLKKTQQSYIFMPWVWYGQHKPIPVSIKLAYTSSDLNRLEAKFQVMFYHKSLKLTRASLTCY